MGNNCEIWLTDRSRSTLLLMLIKNILTLWVQPRLLLPGIYILTNLYTLYSNFQWVLGIKNRTFIYYLVFANVRSLSQKLCQFNGSSFWTISNNSEHIRSMAIRTLTWVEWNWFGLSSSWRFFVSIIVKCGGTQRKSVDTWYALASSFGSTRKEKEMRDTFATSICWQNKITNASPVHRVHRAAVKLCKMRHYWAKNDLATNFVHIFGEFQLNFRHHI